MKILIDMNLTPLWAETLCDAGFEALHWRDVGDPRAPDSEILEWARAGGYILFTHDMDFGALLATTRARGPSVLQVRVNDTMPAAIAADVIRVLHFRQTDLERGALVTLDVSTHRVRVLPI